MDSNQEHLERIPAGALYLDGTLSIPENARGMVLFPYGIESETRISYTAGLAQLLRQFGLATLLADLLTAEEKALDAQNGFFRENTGIMQQRMIGIANWLSEDERTQNLRICYFGIDVTGAAALVAAVERPDLVVAVACAGGRLELARDYLSQVEVPTLLLVGEQDTAGINADRQALEQLHSSNKSLEVIKGATKLFEQSQTRTDVARLAAQWFERHIGLG